LLGNCGGAPRHVAGLLLHTLPLCVAVCCSVLLCVAVSVITLNTCHFARVSATNKGTKVAEQCHCSLFCLVLSCSVLFCLAVSCCDKQKNHGTSTVCCCVLLCLAVCCCVFARKSAMVCAQCLAVCCSVSQCNAVCPQRRAPWYEHSVVVQCVAVRCSVPAKKAIKAASHLQSWQGSGR